MRLKGKNAVVTGAAQGIGRAVCQRFSSEGANVIAVDLNEEEAKKTSEIIREQGGSCSFFKANIGNLKEVESAIEECESQYGDLDIIVNNAGIVRAAMLHKMKESDWDDVINVHLKGTWNGIHAASKKMIPRKGGRIINVTSGAGLRGTIGQINY